MKKYFNMKRSIVLILAVFLLVACKTKQASVEVPNDIEAKEKFVSLYKGACYGKCPVYKITINGDGSFLYYGKSNVQKLGSYKGFIPEEETEPLFDKLITYEWSSFPDEYPIDNVDFPQFTIEYYDGNIRKKIRANSNAAKELIQLAESLEMLSKQLSMEKLN